MQSQFFGCVKQTVLPQDVIPSRIPETVAHPIDSFRKPRQSAMVLSLAEYSDTLDERALIWPRVPEPDPVNATPSIQPLPGIKAVLWDVYGTLLRITEGRFLLFPQEEALLQIALDKTIHEFHMWLHMYRRPGPPWQSMIGLYKSTSDWLQMAGTSRKGDFTNVDLVDVWHKIIERLFEKEYQYDQELMGELREYSEKVAYFFHSNLQGVEARSSAVQAMSDLCAAGVLQGLLADGQSFTLVQLLRALGMQATLPPLYELFRPETLVLSSHLGIRKPSRTLFEHAVSQLRSCGVAASEILHISCRLKTDLVPAKAVGMKTALLAAEKLGLEVETDLLKDPTTRPDRLLTDLSQVASVVGY